MKAIELNFDGLVGPTHQYAGLASGNLASKANAYCVSNPKQAALEGLRKMRFLMNLGIPQGILPPHERPFIPLLRNLGFKGKELAVLKKAYRLSPAIFRACYSASSMWVANAATVTPSVDSQDGRVHFTPANLVSHLHRSLETDMNYHLLKKIFANEKYFLVHKPLINHLDFSDEGAANHNRFCSEYGGPGLHLFVYGRSSGQKQSKGPQRHPARQTLQASQAIARLHRLKPTQLIFAKQNPEAIDHGVFHNDVISVVNQNVFLYHEAAFEKTADIIKRLQERAPYHLYCIGVLNSELSLAAAVRSYLFNSQLLSLPTGAMALVAPLESQENAAASHVLNKILQADNPIQALHFIDCRQSMNNGGGPACLRLRIVLTEMELRACHPQSILDEALYQRLVSWVEKHYRDQLSTKDLLDPALLGECYNALDQLTHLLKLGSIYNFQKI